MSKRLRVAREMGKVAGDFVVSADVLHAFREVSALIRVDGDMCGCQLTVTTMP